MDVLRALEKAVNSTGQVWRVEEKESYVFVKIRQRDNVA